MVTQTTLDLNIIRPGRRVGNTTRQADFAIQMLFDGYSVKVLDHYQDGQNVDMNHRLMNIIIKRIGIEHPALYANKHSLVIDPNTFKIELKKP